LVKHVHNLEITIWSNDGKAVHFMKSKPRGVDLTTFEVLFGYNARV